jgi:hypothetical protein
MPKSVAGCMIILAGLLALDSRIASADEQERTHQSTDLAYLNLGAGLGITEYFEFLDTESVDSSAFAGNFAFSADATARWKQLGLLARVNWVPGSFYGKERWTSDGDTVQKNDLSYQYLHSVTGVGWVLPNGLEPYLGYWYASAKQTRTNFSPSSITTSKSIETIRSVGFAAGLQGVYYDSRDSTLRNFYGDVIVPTRANVTNTIIPGVELHSGGFGFEGGGAFGKTYGQGPFKTVASVGVDFFMLYYNGQVRHDLPGLSTVEWPSNFSYGIALMVKLGGGWIPAGEPSGVTGKD